MNPKQCYSLCCQYHGKVVRIHDINGQVHLGRVVDVTDESVWLEPMDSRAFDLGFGYNGYDDFGRDYGYDYEYDSYYGAGAVIEFAFGFIIGIALAALFFSSRQKGRRSLPSLWEIQTD
ncbi:hypothetical protein GCM10020331_050650 [Ectobacillus funiculus]